MTNVLDGLTAKLSRVPAAYADEAAALFTVIAERNGGLMIRGRYQLTAAEKKRYVYDQGCTLIMEGIPSGFWVWKETGTSAHAIAVRRRHKAKTRGKRRGHGATRGHAPTFTGRPARRKPKPKRPPGRLYGGYGHPVMGPVRHPGTSGRRAWTRTVTEATPKLAQALELALAQAVG